MTQEYMKVVEEQTHAGLDRIQPKRHVIHDLWVSSRERFNPQACYAIMHA